MSAVRMLDDRLDEHRRQARTRDTRMDKNEGDSAEVEESCGSSDPRNRPSTKSQPTVEPAATPRNPKVVSHT